MKGKSRKIHRPPSQERFIQVRTSQYELIQERLTKKLTPECEKKTRKGRQDMKGIRKGLHKYKCFIHKRTRRESCSVSGKPDCAVRPFLATAGSASWNFVSFDDYYEI
jgi:hypothetical protein